MTKKKLLTLALAVTAAALVLLIIWTAWGNTALELNAFKISSDRLPAAFDGYRIAHVSDLHNAEIGDENERLLATLRKAKPDMIAITGDLIDLRNTELDIALSFAKEAMELAPCYFVAGNHEASVPEYFSLIEGLKELGVVVLDDKTVTVEREGEHITVAGILDPTFYSDPIDTAVDRALNKVLDSADSYTVLLSHRPELFNEYAQRDVDLVLSGHAHGGQIRLPLIGGLIAPHQGLFPKYDSGIYTQDSTTMLVSRGIGNSAFPFRFNNRPEVVWIELQSK